LDGYSYRRRSLEAQLTQLIPHCCGKNRQD